MSKTITTLAVAGIAIGAAVYAKRYLSDIAGWFNIEIDGIDLPQPDLTPGAWYCYYLGDYLTAHPGEQVVYSSPLELSNGAFAWATSSPEWDREWFEKRGFDFPANWIPYSELAGRTIPMTSIGS